MSQVTLVKLSALDAIRAETIAASTTAVLPLKLEAQAARDEALAAAIRAETAPALSPVTSVAGRTGNVTLDPSDINGLAAEVRAQIESMVVAGSNVSLTLSGSGATRSLSIASTATGGGPSSSENDYYAVLVTMLRPSKIKMKVGSFGTFTPSGRIYARTLNLCRLGASGTNYVSNLHGTEPMSSFLPISAGSSIVATGSSSLINYVEEADVAAVANAQKTYWKMMAYLTRTAAISHYQATATGAKSGSSITAITPGTYGSMILTLEGQGYEGDVVATISSTNYVSHILAPKGALSTSTASNDWVHQWWGWQHALLPIAATMDTNTISWGLRVYTGNTGYDGYLNARVVDLPSWWDTDEP